MRCFELPQEHADLTQLVQNHAQGSELHPIKSWLDQYTDSPLSIDKMLNPTQAQALAKLIPLLLCGEQSAIHIFNRESLRLYQSSAHNSATKKDTQRNSQAQQYYRDALVALTNIEADERYHEQALQLILSALPVHKEQHQIKRKAQLFYARIAQNTASLAQHFQMIAQLDKCVCILMDAVSKSSLQGTELAKLFELIKKDEAKHVGFAKKHSQLLMSTETASDQTDQPFDVQASLVALLNSHSTTFDSLQIDSQSLFKRLLKTQPLQDLIE